MAPLQTTSREATDQAVVQHNRGVNDILIACVDGLTEFPEEIKQHCPYNVGVHLCIIQPIRNSITQ